ncbi:MAG: tetratricopeptide repeat protein [Clostridia bacterium]|nr:tetratricopeptide repeat protein [Clostridia bacterium]
MNCFEILGIEPTKDTREIKKAYAKKLPKYSPEMDPEGFQKLRAAYEEALAKASEEAERTKDLTPVDQFMAKFQDIYKDFNQRIDEGAWKKLFEADVCYHIDTGWEVSGRILRFIMENYNFPHKIWVLFDSFFSWSTKKDRLYEEFPKNFIDFVLTNIQRKTSLRYEPLIGCPENKQDQFISEYFKGYNALEDFDLYNTKKAIETAKGICENHPDLLILTARYLSVMGKIDEALALFNQVIENDENDLNAYFFRGETRIRTASMEDAYKDYARAIEIKPDSIGTLYSLGKCCIMLGKYKEAIKHTKKLNELLNYNNEVKILLTSACNFYTDELNNHIAVNPEDADLKFDLAEAYHFANRHEESYEVLAGLEQKNALDSVRYRLYCEVLMTLGKEELAYSVISKALQQYPGDYEINHFLALVLHDMGKHDDAVEYYDKAISLKPEEALIYNNKANVLNKMERYNEAIECCNRALSYDSGMAHAYKNKAEALLGLQLYEESLECCEKCLNISPGSGEAYIIKMKVLNDVNQFQEALHVFFKASEMGIRDTNLYLQKANALRLSRKFEEAESYCDMAVELDEKNAQAYECKGFCNYHTEKYKEAVECFEKAIQIDRKLERSYFYKALCHLELSERKEALKELNKAVRIDIKFPNRFYKLKGDIYSEMGEYGYAYMEYKKAADSDPTDASCFYSLGYVLSEQSKFQESLEFFDKALQLDPSMLKAYIDKSYALYSIRRYKECIENCNKAIELEPEYIVAYQNKAWSHYILNQFEEAERTCQQGLKLDPHSESLLGLKLEILRKKGLLDDALIVADRLLELNSDSEQVKAIRNELLGKVSNPLKRIKSYLTGKK